MSSTDLARKLRTKVHRLVRACELDEIAKQLGKQKTLQHDYQTRTAYYWNESEIQKVIELL
jgi:hypothetical protein